jgi:hypothetical protein
VTNDDAAAMLGTVAFSRDDYLRWLDPHRLRGSNLRYCLLALLDLAGRPCSIAELIDQLEQLGLVVHGADPRKTVSDVLRWELTKGRVVRTGFGRYEALPRPPSTARKHRERLRDIVNEGRRRTALGEAG